MKNNVKFSGIRPLQRLGNQARILAFSNPLYEWTLAGRTPEGFQLSLSDLWIGDLQHGRDLLNGIQVFAGQKITSNDFLWEPNNVSDDWLISMHGFDWLRNLRALGGDQARYKARQMVLDWIYNYDRWHPLIWRPDVIGQRLSSWISFYVFFGESADDEFQEIFLASISKQLKHLMRVLPKDCHGVDLIQALKGVVYAVLALGENVGRLESVFNVLLKELKEQILLDGGHISRSPEKHVLLLRYLIDIRGALITANLEVPSLLQHSIDKMVPALKFFKYGDGDLPSFHGSRSVNPALCDMIINQSGVKARSIRNMRYSGYEKMMQGRTLLMMDVSVPSSVEYNNRSHLGLLAFELSVGRERIIVNCGGSPSLGAWNDALRCTAAHSTLCLDNRNAYIFESDDAESNAVKVQSKRQDIDGECFVESEHNGYVNDYGIMHHRDIRMKDQGRVIIGQDSLKRVTDTRIGKLKEKIGDIEYCIRFHLHPMVQASLIQSGAEVLIRTGQGIGWRMSFSENADMVLSLEESIYYADSDDPRRTTQLVIMAKIPDNCPDVKVGWEIRREVM